VPVSCNRRCRGGAWPRQVVPSACRMAATVRAGSSTPTTRRAWRSSAKVAPEAPEPVHALDLDGPARCGRCHVPVLFCRSPVTGAAAAPRCRGRSVPCRRRSPGAGPGRRGLGHGPVRRPGYRSRGPLRMSRRTWTAVSGGGRAAAAVAVDQGALEAVVATARLSPSAAASGHDAPALDGLPRTHDHGREMTVLPLVGRERELGARRPGRRRRRPRWRPGGVRRGRQAGSGSSRARQDLGKGSVTRQPVGFQGAPERGTRHGEADPPDQPGWSPPRHRPLLHALVPVVAAGGGVRANRRCRRLERFRTPRVSAGAAAGRAPGAVRGRPASGRGRTRTGRRSPGRRPTRRRG
jgi:hypothetical protein